MWRKIHSNRDPRDTLYSELRKEFSTYFGRADQVSRGIAGRYPKFLFGAMVLLLLLSMILSLTVFRHAKATVHPAVKQQKANPVEEGFNQILQATGKIKETLQLKHEVDSLASKKQLTRADSLTLDSALNRLEHLRKP
jgi:hypothetical protein